MSSRSNLFALLACAISSMMAVESAKAAAPNAPSNLEVTALGVNAFELKWKDNSDNETGWDVMASLAGGKPQHYQFIPTANITRFILFTNDLPGYGLVFQLAAYNGEVGQEVVSNLTPVVAVKALSPNTFNAPTGLTAASIDDGRVRLNWTDNANSEGGYLIEFKQTGTQKWKLLGTLETAMKYSIVASGLSPSKSYSFRTRAFKPDGLKRTGFSNVAEAKTQSLRPPTNLAVTPHEEGSFSFRWKDQSSVESGFELQQDVGDGKFALLGTVSANTSSTSVVKDFVLDRDIKFRMRTYQVIGTRKKYSTFSKVVSTHSTALAKPAWIAFKSSTDTTAILKWKDLSERESGYRVDYRKVGTTAFSVLTTGPNTETLTVPELTPGRDYEFRVRASDQFSGSFSPPAGFATGRTKEGIIGNLSPILSVGVNFSYTILFSNATNLTDLTVTGLPPELTFNPATRKITGMVNHDGNYTLTVTATFSDGSSSVRTLTIRSTTPPVVAGEFAAQNIGVGSNSVVSVTGKFEDPDTTSAARFETTLGNFDIIFFPVAAPQTVDNFIDYMDALKYDGIFFHRAPPEFVVQTGGYKYVEGSGFTELIKFDPVINEPGISNLRGTVAMAKIGGQPDSATSEWFVNLKDNAANLDFQNGGFTVFGRVPDSGMTIIDQISNLPIRDYDITVDSVIEPFEDVPINDTTAPAVLDPAKLVKVLTSGPAPILTYAVTSANPAIATATLSGTNITISAVSSGTTSIQVKATDLDGNTVSQNISITVP